MSLDDHINKLEKQKSEAKIFVVISLVAVIGIFIMLLVAAFQTDRLSAICAMLIIIPNLFYLLKSYRIRVEGRLLRELKSEFDDKAR